MTATLTRRRAVLSIATAVAAGFLPIDMIEPLPAEQPLADRPSDEPERTYPELAEALARMELRAIRSSHPRHWQQLSYTGVIPLDGSAVLFYGVGRPGPAADDAAALLGYLACELGEETRAIAGVYRTPCGRSWALIVDASVVGRCVADRSQAGWRRETLSRLQAFDEAVGRQARTCAI